MAGKLCPYDKLPCNPECVLCVPYRGRYPLKDDEGKTRVLPALCRKFGVI